MSKIKVRKKNKKEKSKNLRIFDKQTSRKPNLYPMTDKFIKAMHDGFWSVEEFNFANDVHAFKTVLNDVEKEVTVRTLSAIGQIEVEVKTFWGKVGEHLPHPSIQDLGYVMANTEVIHNIAYERLLSVLDLEDVFEENLKLDWIKGRVKYLKKYNHRYYKDSKKQYLYALILFTLFVENVSLFSQFYIIMFFSRFKNILKKVDQQVKYTRNEETIHAMVGAYFVNTICDEYPELVDDELKDRIEHEANEAFIAESKIVDWMVNGMEEEYETDHGVAGLSAEILKEFIKSRINDSMEMIGFKKVFEIDEVLIAKTEWFDEEIKGNNMPDFFATKPTEYSKRNQSFDADDLFD